MKNSYLIIICILLLIGQRSWGESVTKTVHFSHSELKCDTITGADGQVYNILSYPGCINSEKIGTPTLPMGTVKLRIPREAEVQSLNINTGKKSTHSLTSKIYPVQYSLAFSTDVNKVPFVPCDSLIYNSVSQFPSENGRVVSYYYYHQEGEKDVIVEIYPISYLPKENKYEFSEDITVNIFYSIPAASKNESDNILTRTSLGIPFYEYTVITTRALKDSFYRLIAWKKQKGYKAGVVCVEDIVENNQIQGDVNYIESNKIETWKAGKIRQYLRLLNEARDDSLYVQNQDPNNNQNGNWKELYVLFGGDSKVVPIRVAKRESDTLSFYIQYEDDTIIPSDWYYSELNTIWPADSTDELQTLSFGADISVGRLLCSTAQEVNIYTNKLLRYEMNPGNGDYSYLKKAFYLQADEGQLFHQADSVANADTAIFTTRTIFEEYPTYNSAPPSSPTGNEVIAELRNRYGYASFYSHGTPYCIKTKTYDVNVNHSDFNPTTYAITSVQGADSIIVHETANGLDKLNNAYYPMFMYTASCHSAPFDTYDRYDQYPCIGRSFTTLGNYGGPAMIGNTRLGPVASSYILQKWFNENLIAPDTNYWHIGKAFRKAKNRFSANTPLYIYQTLTANLIGCPELPLWTDIPTTFNGRIGYGGSSVDSIIIDNSNLWGKNVIVGVRHVTEENDSPTIEPIWLDNEGIFPTMQIQNCLVTLTQKNCKPEILPLILQGVNMKGHHHLITKNVSCGSGLANINEPENFEGDVVFKSGSDYTFEKKGTFTLGKNVKIEKGAKLKIVNSNKNY